MGLLDLPAELRLSIYELLLGGRTIHVGDPLYPASTDQDGFFLCEAAVADMDLRSRDIQSIAEVFTHRHLGCSKRPAFRKDELNILRVCRRIHKEAALIPFSSNVFAVSAPRLITKLRDQCTLAQREAISHLLLYQTNHRKYWRTPDHSTNQPPIRDTLPRLSHLSLYLETCPADLGASNGHFHVGRTAANAGINAPGELDEVFGVVQELATEILKEVNVNVVDTTWLDEYRKGNSACADLDERVIEEWQASMKKRLLGPGTARTR
ncbi:hypothetical protein D0869_10765 [Hortaea werneckii]|uniref:DUF7730 domain-containing protein n=1 Tax=Hortaea werneckii TaxID=91943 RepID=A0A3M6WDQ4_HORWE|nr:hypothetical protein D0869_10765 [Hortaea werneckii]